MDDAATQESDPLQRLIERRKRSIAAAESIGDMNLHIAEGAYRKMHLYQALYERLSGQALEFYAYMVSKEGEDVITNVYLPGEQANVHTLTEIPGPAITKAVNELHERGYLVRGWTHCHPHFGTHPSGTDRRNNENILLSVSGYNQRHFYTEETAVLGDLVEDGKIVLYDKSTGQKTILPVAGLEDRLNEEVVIRTPHTAAFMHSMVISGDQNNIYAETVSRSMADSRSNIINPPRQVEIVRHELENDVAMAELKDMPQMILDVLNSIDIDRLNPEYIFKLEKEEIIKIVKGAEKQRIRTAVVSAITDEDLKIELTYAVGDPQLRREVLRGIRDKDRRLNLVMGVEDRGIVDLVMDYVAQYNVGMPAVYDLLGRVKSPEHKIELYFRYGDVLARTSFTRKEEQVRQEIRQFYQGVPEEGEGAAIKNAVFERYKSHLQVDQRMVLAPYLTDSVSELSRRLYHEAEEAKKPATLLQRIGIGRREEPEPAVAATPTRPISDKPYEPPHSVLVTPPRDPWLTRYFGWLNPFRKRAAKPKIEVKDDSPAMQIVNEQIARRDAEQRAREGGPDKGSEQK